MSNGYGTNFQTVGVALNVFVYFNKVVTCGAQAHVLDRRPSYAVRSNIRLRTVCPALYNGVVDTLVKSVLSSGKTITLFEQCMN